MKEIKKVLLKMLLLALVLIGLDQVYRHFFFAADLEKFSPAMEQVLAARDSARIVYVGESSNFTFRDEDADKRSISQFTAAYFPEIPFATIQKAASHAGIYHTFLQNLVGSDSLETVIVTLNLRSFDANWIYSKLETALQKANVLPGPGPPLWRRMLLSFKAYDIKTELERREQFKAKWLRDTLNYPSETPHATVQDWEHHIRKYGRTNADGSRNKFLTNLATSYVKSFAFHIDPADNPRIDDFDAIARLAQGQDWKLVYLLVPDNVSRAGELVPDLPWIMRQNRDLLVDRYRKMGVTVVDLLELLPNDAFIDQDWTTEHYIESGRKAVAEKLSAALREFYPQAYTPVVYRKSLEREFFNDCEGNKIWLQMGCLSDDRAYSGKKSARVGKDKPFGLSLTRAIPDLDSNYLDSVAVSFWLYQEDREHLASIVVEAGGDVSGYMWDSTSIGRYAQAVDQWVKVEAHLPLRSAFSKAEVMKIYMYNPSPRQVWVDDIHIRFIGKPETTGETVP